MKRDTRVTIKVTAELRNELDNLAQSYGLTMSSLGAFIIGQFMESVRERKARPPVATAVDHCPGAPE
ncbi:MAG TPA: hypothetical protein PKN87_04710 [Syntrophomonadaceae bacterium]|nr:hypothetical protein [Syntrophomonadaceae bacterium]HNX28698.1 hypothetical protein [Syntrophomonadaceae bacterium]HPR93504.1 hypothetical protein [Syntrophomonadaceae bacterium]HPR93506.1 hypothetical protein [Syntrophomonadaceae bacterium]